jgi:hypothetical protein
VRTSGAGHENVMTFAMLGILLGVLVLLAGGPGEFLWLVNITVRDVVQAVSAWFS